MSDLPKLPAVPEHPAAKKRREERIKVRRRAAFIRAAAPALLATKEYNIRHDHPLDRYERAVHEAEILADVLARKGYL